MNTMKKYIQNKIHQLKNWMTEKAQTKSAVVWLCVFAFIESIFFPIPTDVFLGSLITLREKRSWFMISLYATIFSVLGGAIGFFIGKLFFDGVKEIVLGNIAWKEHFEAAALLFDQGGFYAVFVSAFSPIPYKVFTVSAGFFGTSFGVFMLASLLGRGIRFLLVGFLFHYFGKKIATVVYRFFGWATLLVVLIIVGYFLLKS
ncbi:MAG: membrane protein YqaA with SNARE-associated domain [Flavobacteriaceae bacterium]|jgi:membrane protein YqaA with SNARE-associated domain